MIRWIVDKRHVGTHGSCVRARRMKYKCTIIKADARAVRPYMRVNNQLVHPFTRQLPTEFFLIELLSGHFLPANEHQPEQHKVDGNGYQHHENRRKPLARTQPKEKIEQSYLQKIV